MPAKAASAIATAAMAEEKEIAASLVAAAAATFNKMTMTPRQKPITKKQKWSWENCK